MTAMPRYPSFYLLGAIAGLVIWLIEAPPPFPFLGLTAMASGALGVVLSLAYLQAFEPWQWRVKLAALRRVSRAAMRIASSPRRRASELRALRATG